MRRSTWWSGATNWSSELLKFRPPGFVAGLRGFFPTAFVCGRQHCGCTCCGLSQRRRVPLCAACGASTNALAAREHHEVSQWKHQFQVKPEGCHSKACRALFKKSTQNHFQSLAPTQIQFAVTNTIASDDKTTIGHNLRGEVLGGAVCTCAHTALRHATSHHVAIWAQVNCLSFCRQFPPKSPVGDVFLVLHRERQHVQDGVRLWSSVWFFFFPGQCEHWRWVDQRLHLRRLECSTLSENSTESAVWLEFHFRGRSSHASVRSGGCW